MAIDSPLVIGGTGGSGTRLVARLACLAGRYMGDDRSEAEDSRRFAGFDWRWGLRYLESGASADMEQEFDRVVTSHLESRSAGTSWGWKCPHSYLLIPFLRSRFPHMRFIHVVRDGRDISFSENQLQAMHYGARLVPRSGEPSEVASAAWWNWANLRAWELGEWLGPDYLAVRLEDVCDSPDWGTRILEFCGCEEPDRKGAELTELVERPGSLGRWRRRDPALVDRVEAACLSGLRRFGYA